MFWVMIPGILPGLVERGQRPVAAAGFCTAELLFHREPPRQLSSRASWLARKSPNSIGRILVQMPPGERKSGMPHSVEMPAPVNGTTVPACSTISRSLRIPVSRSDAIID